MVSTDIEPAEWDAFVLRHPEGRLYHLWRWRLVFGEAFGHTCEYLAAREAGQVTGVLPLVYFRHWLFGRFAVSLPFVNYGGLLAATNEAADALVNAAVASARSQRLSHIEFRHSRQRLPALPFKQHKVAMLLPLASSEGQMWARLDRKVRNQVRKAEKSQLDVAVGGHELLDDFYRVFARNMRDLGTPVYSSTFFKAVTSHFPERTRVFVVRHKGQPAGAAISVAHGDTIEVPWASAVRECLPLCPNNLLYWSVIQHAIGEGFRTLDFGRSTPNEGTFQFKRQWGAEPVPLYWEYQLLSRRSLPDQGPHNPKFKWAIEAWKHLPVSLATQLGPPIVRGIP